MRFLKDVGVEVVNQMLWHLRWAGLLFFVLGVLQYYGVLSVLLGAL